MDRGFEHFDAREGAYVGRYLALAQLSGRDLWAGRLTYRDARSITTAALNWLDRRRKDEPFFLMLNYLDAHTPYLTRAPHNEEFKDAVLAGVLASDSRELAYERNIHFLDAELGRLLDGLADRALIAGSLVVITSDHGEAFGEHGFQEHCWTLYEEVVRVPLYVKPPEGRRAARDGTRVNSADVAWMILDELGIPHGGPPAPASGLERPSSEWWRQVPMTEKYMAFAASVERNLDRDLIAWFEGDRKYVVSTLGEVEVFDVVLDPREEHPLELAEEERDRAFLRALEWWDANPLEAAQTETIPPDRLERLRALGYAGREN